MRIRNFLIIACIAALSSTAAAQKYLEKPYSEWSKSEATKIVNESAWAKTHQNVAVTAGSDGRQMVREQGRGGGNPGSVSRTLGVAPVVIRLHSAPVIRQAMVRLQQMGVNYDKMGTEEKAAFDANRKGFLDCAICNEYYVVTLTKFVDSSGETVDDGIFQSMSLDDMKGNVRLENDKGERRELVQFTPPKVAGDSAVFFFKRADENGNMLITPDSKELRFVFENAFLTSGNRYGGLVPRAFEFKVSKLLIDGKVAF